MPNLLFNSLCSFLVRRGYVKPVDTDYELARLAIAYLCFPEISSKLSSADVRDAVLTGSYSFYEYAVACWVPHLLSWLNKPSEEHIRELAEELEVLLELHYSQPQKLLVISKTMHDRLRDFNGFGFYDDFVQAVAFSRKQLVIDKMEVSNTETLTFPAITAQVRLEIEQILSADLFGQAHTTLKKYYGHNLFKCPHLSCQYFYKGFSKREDRDRHRDRHDRAYNCTFEGCPTSLFGCLSKKDLDKHMLEAHGIVSDEQQFPVLKNTHSSRTQGQTSRFQCSLCSKSFTRRHNLENHRRAHDGERPHKCDVCGLAFVRKYDQSRHARLHDGIASFVCEGILDNGDKWGCGKRFARADTLKSHHFEGISGHSCIKPWLEEQARLQKADVASSSDISTTSQPFDVEPMISPNTSPPFSRFESVTSFEEYFKQGSVELPEKEDSKIANLVGNAIPDSYFEWVDREYNKLYDSLDLINATGDE